MSKYHKHMFATELIFCNNPKPNGKIPLAFCRGNKGDANFRIGLQKYFIHVGEWVRVNKRGSEQAGQRQVFPRLADWEAGLRLVCRLAGRRLGSLLASSDAEEAGAKLKFSENNGSNS